MLRAALLYVVPLSGAHSVGNFGKDALVFFRLDDGCVESPLRGICLTLLGALGLGEHVLDFALIVCVHRMAWGSGNGTERLDGAADKWAGIGFGFADYLHVSKVSPSAFHTTPRGRFPQSRVKLGRPMPTIGQLAGVFPHPDPKKRLEEIAEEKREKARRRAMRRVWRTKEGDEIPYSNIDNKHLVNILLMLRRSSQEKAEKEASTLGLELVDDNGWKACKPAAWDGLVEELESRGDWFGKAIELIENCDTIKKAEVIRRAIPKNRPM